LTRVITQKNYIKSNKKEKLKRMQRLLNKEKIFIKTEIKTIKNKITTILLWKQWKCQEHQLYLNSKAKKQNLLPKVLRKSKFSKKIQNIRIYNKMIQSNKYGRKKNQNNRIGWIQNKKVIHKLAYTSKTLKNL